MTTSKKQVWYHVTDDWRQSTLVVLPRQTRRDEGDEDRKDAIHVCPSVAQCIVAIGDWQSYDTLRVYETTALAFAATQVFDYSLTQEHRIYQPCRFHFVCTLDKDFLEKNTTDLITFGITDDATLLVNLAQNLRELQAALAMQGKLK